MYGWLYKSSAPLDLCMTMCLMHRSLCDCGFLILESRYVTTRQARSKVMGSYPIQELVVCCLHILFLCLVRSNLRLAQSTSSQHFWTGLQFSISWCTTYIDNKAVLTNLYHHSTIISVLKEGRLISQYKLKKKRLFSNINNIYSQEIKCKTNILIFLSFLRLKIKYVIKC